jgi:hypothetical protein
MTYPIFSSSKKRSKGNSKIKRTDFINRESERKKSSQKERGKKNNGGCDKDRRR